MQHFLHSSFYEYGINREKRFCVRKRVKRLLRNVCLLIVSATVLTSAIYGTSSDIVPGAWYEDAVLSMWEQGYLAGYPDGTFRPNQSVTAAEYVTILSRIAGLSTAPPRTGHWASGNMEGALRAGWYDWDEIPPTGEHFDEPILRQLAVKILMNALFPEARGDYNTEAYRMQDFSQLDGRYYNAVFAAYASGLVCGDEQGNFHPKGYLSRAEACMLLYRAMQGIPATEKNTESVPASFGDISGGGVSKHGWLQVRGTQLCGEVGEPVMLRGMSSHGLYWFPQYTGEQPMRNLAAYGANIFRVAMYTGEGGYLSQKDMLRGQMITAVEAAIAADMYVIIDWHILSDGNPSDHTEEAVSFFQEMAERYGDSPAVLYEICNEPNGNVQWSRDVKPYAEELIQTIRASAPRSIILVGSPTWSQDIHEAARDPLTGDNLMYTLHFYAGTHGEELRERARSALDKGIPIFVSEWGTSWADGSGGMFRTESTEWLSFLEDRQISWCNWSLCDKNESSAALLPGTPADRLWDWNDFSDSGSFVFSKFQPES